MKSNSQISVLLVDDHKMVRAGIRRFLEKDPTIKIVSEAESAVEARQLVALHSLDVALLDIKMPDGNGIELTRELRKTYPTLGILIVSAFDDVPFIKAALRAGANGYMLKSAEPLQLIRAVQSVAQGKSAFDPALVDLMDELTAGIAPADLAVQFSEREQEVLQLAAQGMTNKEVGAVLSISDRTVQSHMARIFRKLDVKTRAEAVKVAIGLGVISAET